MPFGKRFQEVGRLKGGLKGSNKGWKLGKDDLEKEEVGVKGVWQKWKMKGGEKPQKIRLREGLGE